MAKSPKSARDKVPVKKSRKQDLRNGHGNISSSVTFDVDDEFSNEGKENTNLLKQLDNLIYGRQQKRASVIHQVQKSVVKEYLDKFSYGADRMEDLQLHQFTRRITCLQWHPKLPFICVAGSKFGDFVIVDKDYNETEKPVFRVKHTVRGPGPDSSLLSMKFHEDNQSVLFSASLDGTVKRTNITANSHLLFHAMDCYSQWFTSMDISCSTKTLLAGDNKGNAFLFTLDGELVNSFKIHRNKIHHCEFNPKLPYLFATSSLDDKVGVKLWDLRKLSETTPLASLPHRKGVNVAHFNPSDGSRLLTSDQYDEIRVYQGPLWNDKNKLIIPHPHRQFQHITPIKAHWHPMCDVIVIGRYPTEKDALRPIEFIDADTGKCLQSIQPVSNGLVSLNGFNSTGEFLASSMSAKLVIWKPYINNWNSNKNMEKSESNLSQDTINALRGIGQGRRRRRDEDDEDSDGDLKKRAKTTSTRPRATSTNPRSTKRTQKSRK